MNMVFSRDQVLKAPPEVYESVAEFCAVIWKVPKVALSGLPVLAPAFFAMMSMRALPR